MNSVVGVPKLIQKLYPKRIWEIPVTSKEIFLTFDDGPIPEITPWVLKQLKEYNAKATFFCIGENIKKYPNIFKSIISNGHHIGNHTYNHLNGWETPTEEYLKNTEKTQQLIQELAPKQHSRKLFRPPYGRMTHKQATSLRKKGYELIMWSILSYDYDNNTSEVDCLGNVLNNIKPGKIVVFHDSQKAEKNLRYALPKVLETLSKEGYVFKAL